MPPIPIIPPSEIYGSCSVCGSACYRDGEMIRCSECHNSVHTYNWARTPSLTEIAERAAAIRQVNLALVAENKRKSAGHLKLVG